MVRVLDAIVLPAILVWAWLAHHLGYADNAAFLRQAVAGRRKDAAEERDFYIRDDEE